MGIAALAVLLAVTAAPAPVELPVSEPRPFIAKDERVDGALSSDGKSPIAAWRKGRAQEALLASRVRRGSDPVDAAGIRLVPKAPSGDGATAFWSEQAPSRDRTDLHATRFTASGIDPRLHDRILGSGIPLGSDGTNVLLSDGRLIAPAGETVATVDVPKDAWAAGWDGGRWLFVTWDSTLVLGRGRMKLDKAGAFDLACTTGACLVTWIAEETRGGKLVVHARALHIPSGRPLIGASARMPAVDIGEHQAIGAAAAGDTLLAFWADRRARNVQGRAFDAKGRMGEPFVVASPVAANDPLFFRAGSGGGEALVVQTGWPRQRLVRLHPDGSLAAAWLFENTQPRGAVRVGGRTLIFVERRPPAGPYVPAKRGFVIIAP